MESVFAASQMLLLRPQIPIGTRALKLSAAAQSESHKAPFDFRYVLHLFIHALNCVLSVSTNNWVFLPSGILVEEFLCSILGCFLLLLN